MRQATVVNALYKLRNQMKAEEYDEIKKELKAGRYDQVELELLHNAFMRDKTDRIEGYLKTIKNIAVLMVVFMVIGALVMVLS